MLFALSWRVFLRDDLVLVVTGQSLSPVTMQLRRKASKKGVVMAFHAHVARPERARPHGRAYGYRGCGTSGCYGLAWRVAQSRLYAKGRQAS